MVSSGPVSADTARIQEHRVEGDYLIAHVYYDVSGSRTLELWVQDPDDEESTYFISKKKVSGKGITTLVGECCFRYPNRFSGKLKECICEHPSIEITYPFRIVIVSE